MKHVVYALSHSPAGIVEVKFVSDSTYQPGTGFFFTYTTEGPKPCHNRLIDLSNMGATASGWLSNDMTYHLQNTPGVSLTTPPAGLAATWLKGYLPSSNCNLRVRAAPGASMSVAVNYMDIEKDADLLQVYQGEVPDNTTLVQRLTTQSSTGVSFSFVLDNSGERNMFAAAVARRVHKLITAIQLVGQSACLGHLHLI